MREKSFRIAILPHGCRGRAAPATGRTGAGPSEREADIRFASIRSLAQILSPENQALLKVIMDRRPQSLTELERLSQRKKSNLSRTLHTLQSHGIVELSRRKGKLVPRVTATRFRLEFSLDGGRREESPTGPGHSLNWVCC